MNCELPAIAGVGATTDEVAPRVDRWLTISSSVVVIADLALRNMSVLHVFLGGQDARYTGPLVDLARWLRRHCDWDFLRAMGEGLALVAAPAFVVAMVALQPALPSRKAWRWPVAGLGLVAALAYFVCQSSDIQQSLPDGSGLVLPDLLTSVAFYLLFGAVLWERIDAHDHGSPVWTLLKFLTGYFGLAVGVLLVGGIVFLGAGSVLFGPSAPYSSDRFNLGFAMVSSIAVIVLGVRLARKWKWPAIGMVYGSLAGVHGMLQGGCVYRNLF